MAKISIEGKVDPAAAEKALKIHYATLVLVIHEATVPELAGHLYSEGVISRSLMHKLAVLGLSPCEKSILILTEIEDQIPSNANVFNSFVTALKSIGQLKEMAVKLVMSYCELCSVLTTIITLI